jgi:hypothetical protein
MEHQGNLFQEVFFFFFFFYEFFIPFVKIMSFKEAAASALTESRQYKYILSNKTRI